MFTDLASSFHSCGTLSAGYPSLSSLDIVTFVVQALAVPQRDCAGNLTTYSLNLIHPRQLKFSIQFEA